MNNKHFFRCNCICLMAIMLAMVLHVEAQRRNSVVKKRAQPPQPSWITMMEDPNVNYNKAVQAFNDYWKHKQKPEEENELFEKEAEEREMLKQESLSVKERNTKREREERQKKLDKNAPAAKYAEDYKRFKNWMREVEPFVQPDGRILTMDERISLWKRQQEQQKRQRIDSTNKQ